MQLFYNQNIDTTTEMFTFDKEESKHIIKVLRKKGGDQLFVTNGLGYLFTTEIILGSDTKCSVKIIGITKQDESKVKLHLAVAPTKLNDRFEWFLEKATEIGINEITPIICDHSERKFIKSDRFDKIILSAMKQSGQVYLPKLNEPTSFKDFIATKFESQCFIAHCEDSKKNSLKNSLLPNQSSTIIIGPEGDFSTKEINLALEKKFIPVTLGTTRLRTETAAVVACHSFVYANEN